MGLQIFSQHLERSGTTDKSKIQSGCHLDISQNECNNGLQTRLFFFRGTFHNMFQTRRTCTYDCIGTSGKNCQTPMREFW